MTEPRDNKGSLDARIHSENASSGTPYAAHEMTDATPGPIVRFALILLASIAVVFVVTTALFSYFKRSAVASDPKQHPLAASREFPPDPRLQANQNPLGQGDENGFTTARWQEHLARDVQTLSTYGWIDKQAGVVRVPIERAIELTIERGLPATTPKSESK